MRQSHLSAVVLATTLGVLPAAAGYTQAADDASRPRSFVFGTTSAGAAKNTVAVAPGTPYSPETGYGFEPQTTPASFTADSSDETTHRSFLSADQPFYFSVRVPPGNYRVTVTFAGGGTGSNQTVKAELRRLMLANVAVARGMFVTRSFVVNVRTPQIAGGGTVRRKAPRETTEEAWAWDDKLTLDFEGKNPGLAALTVEPVTVPTVYLLGDSTVCDQPSAPYASWGQMLTRFFGPTVAVSNQAESGETVAGATHAGRFAKILGDMKPGDYLFVQFGHNDMKSAAPDASTQYQNQLRQWVQQVKARGGIPVLVTPMNRHTFEGSTVTNSLRDYPDKVRELAAAESVALIDLNRLSKTLYEALGPTGSVPLFAPQAGGKYDHTHHSDYGAYELARCIVAGIRQNKLPLVKDLVEESPVFDPAHPDPFRDFDVPSRTARHAIERPAGS